MGREAAVWTTKSEDRQRTVPTAVLMVAMEAAIRRVVRARQLDIKERRHGADTHWSQARSQVFRQNSRSGRNAEPHRGSEGFLRSVSAREGAGRRAPRRGTAGRVQVGIPDFRLLGHLHP